MTYFELKSTAAKASYFHLHLCAQIEFYHRYELLQHDILPLHGRNSTLFKLTHSFHLYIGLQNS